jgi:tripeptide aminopeptidase
MDTGRRIEVDGELATALLLRLLAVEGTTGHEKRVGLEIATLLGELGVSASAISFDDAHHRIPLPTESGNLVVDIDGDPSLPRRLFMAHTDTVPLAAGAKPQRDGDRIVSRAPTALGGDDRTGVACLVYLVAALRQLDRPRPPLTLLFTVREESGMWGVRCLDPERLGRPALAFNVDGPSPSGLRIGAVGGTVWKAEITGRAAHAGLFPERGISAPLVAAHALSLVHRRGWWGRIRRGDWEGTSNAGSLSGRDGGAVGGATNVVADYAVVEGEARSHDADFIPRIVAAYERAFTAAAGRVTDERGERAKLAFSSEKLYDPFRMDPDSEVVRFAVERSREVGLEPRLEIANGGLDANWMVRHGIPTVSYGAGQRNIHTVDEFVDLPEFLEACRLTVALAT